MAEIAPDPPGWLTALRFDIDTEGGGAAWLEAELPAPNLVVVNPRNGHAHLIYLLGGWIRTNFGDPSRLKVVRYAAAIERAYATALGADTAYSGRFHHNPLSDAYVTKVGRDAPYSLAELAQYVDLTTPAVKPVPLGIGRNVEVFDRLRRWAYTAIADERPGRCGAPLAAAAQLAKETYGDDPVFTPRYDQGRAAADRRLRRMSRAGRLVGPPAPVSGVRSRRLLRLFEEQARNQALSSDEASHHRFVGEGRTLEVVLYRRGRLGVALFAALSLFCGCAKTGGSDGPPSSTTVARHSFTKADTLRIGSGFVPRTLNPLLGTQTIEASINRLFSDILVTVDGEGRFVPDLAKEVPTIENGDISSDGLTIRYPLRAGVKWQDGVPFTSEDVKFSYDAIMNPNNDIISRHGYDVVKSVETPDENTVVFHLKERFAPFVATVFGESDAPYGIVPAHILGKEKTINDVPFNALPIGTGPFRVTRWLRGNQIEFTRNDDYFQGKPKLKSIVIKLIPDENTLITQMRTHEIDWFFEASVNAYKALREISPTDLRMVLTPFNGYQGLMFNTAKGPTKDVRVRRAILYALDKNSLVHNLTFGAADTATQDIPSFLWAYDKALSATPFNLAASRSLLAQAGYGPSHRLALEMYFEQSSALNKTASVQIQSSLQSIGIDVHMHPQLSSVIYGGYGANGTLARGKYDIALYLWIAGIDPDDSSQFTCANRPPHGFNQSYYCNHEMDAAQSGALTIYDQNRRKIAYSRIQQNLATNVPMDFLWWPRQIQAVNPDLQHFDPNPVAETWDAWRWSI